MVKAVIFDMDGVISDTQKLHAKIESEIFSRFGLNLTPEEITKRFAGRRIKEMFEEVLKDRDYSLDELVEEKRNKIFQLAALGVEPIEGSIELIKELYKNNIPLAVASASQSNYVKKVLEKLNILDLFDTIISGDMVKNGKPHPESFMTAADKLGIDYENCLVIEDGESSMIAAREAGMKCIELVEDMNKEYPTKNLVLSLEEVDLDYIWKLFNPSL
jgi:beta-phosphoglucomutase family hydrolase